MQDVILAKMEPLPFLPPWLYLALFGTVLLGWLMRYLFSWVKARRINFDFKDIELDGLYFRPLKIEELSLVSGLTEQRLALAENEVGRFGAAGIIVESEGATIATVCFYPAEYPLMGIETPGIDWLAIASLYRENAQYAVLFIDKLDERVEISGDVEKKILDFVAGIAAKNGFGRIIVSEEVAGKLEKGILDEAGFEIVESNLVFSKEL